MIYQRANYQCELCGNTQGLQKHHIVKRSQGGGDNQANIILLCWHCHHGTKGVHGKRGHKLDLQLKAGLEKYYRKCYNEKKVKELMGGKFYLWQVEVPEFIDSHFNKLKEE